MKVALSSVRETANGIYCLLRAFSSAVIGAESVHSPLAFMRQGSVASTGMHVPWVVR